MVQIEIKDISIAYLQRIVLQNVSLTIEEHDFVGIIGPNGCGKTSLLRCILGLTDPVAGSISFFKDGNPSPSISVGYLPQCNQIDKKFPISVREVVRSGLGRQKKLWKHFTSQDEEKVSKLLHEMHLEHLSSRDIGRLSGGELQRVLLARAVVSNPDILMLDEPSTYMDRHFSTQLYEMLYTLNQQHTILLVSHDLEEVHHHATKILDLGCHCSVCQQELHVQELKYVRS